MPNRCIGCRHDIKTIGLGNVVIERAAHDEPHHHLDPFGTGLARVLHVRDAGELFRVVAEVIEEVLVPLAVDQAGAVPADLM